MGNAGSYERPTRAFNGTYAQCVRDFRISSLEQLALVVGCVDDWRELHDGGLRICKIGNVAVEALGVYAFQDRRHQDAVVDHCHVTAILRGLFGRLHQRSKQLLLVAALAVLNTRAQHAIYEEAVKHLVQGVDVIRKDLRKATTKFTKHSVDHFEDLAIALTTLCVLLDSNARNQLAARSDDFVDRLGGIRNDTEAYYSTLRNDYLVREDTPTDVKLKLHRADHQIQCGVHMLRALLDVSDVPFASPDAVVMLRVTQDDGIETIERVVCSPMLLTRPFEGTFGGLAHSKWLVSNGAKVLLVGDSYPTSDAQLLWATSTVALGYTKFLILKGGVPAEIERPGGDTLLSIRMHHRAATVLVKYLVENGARVNPVQLDATTPLHIACHWRNEELIGFLIRNQADLHAEDKMGETALSILRWRLHVFDKTLMSEANTLRKWTYEIAYRLCGLGATWHRTFIDAKTSSLLESDVQHDDSKDWLRWFQALADCVDVWIAQHKASAPLTHFTIKKATTNDEPRYDHVPREFGQRTHRLTVCLVGKSGSGKTSLLKSIWWEREALTKPQESTVGIQATTLSFSMPLRTEPAPDPEEFEVLCYDYSGQDTYQLAHAPFFAHGTPYLQCIDLALLVEKCKQVQKLPLNARDKAMSRFVAQELCSWARVILMCKPEAEFKLVFTKSDTVTTLEINDALKDLRIYLNKWKDDWLADLKNAKSITTETYDSLRQSLAAVVGSVPPDASEGLVVSSASDASAEVAKRQFAAFVAERASLVELPRAYSQVWEVIRPMREAPVRDLVLYTTGLESRVQSGTSNLSASDYKQVLSYLQAQGLIAVYDTLVVMDPTLLHKLIGEVVAHTHEKSPGEAFETLRTTGKLKNSLLMTFPTWSQFHDQPSIIAFFKEMMQKNGVAYPMGSSDLATSNIMVPTFWKQDDTTQQLPTADPDSHMLQWRYELSANMSALIFKEFAVRSHRRGFDHTVSVNSFTAFVEDKFEAYVVRTTTNEFSDTITIQVISEEAISCESTMRFFVMAMERVLGGYPSLQVNRSLCRSGDTFKSVAEVVRVQSDERTLPSYSDDKTDAFPDLAWYEQKAWRDPTVMVSLNDRDELLKNLRVLTGLVGTSDSKLQFPALFTIQYSPEKKSLLELRFYSDLTGECWHAGMVVQLPNAFLAKHAKWLKAGVMVFSLLAIVIVPKPIIEMITKKAEEYLTPRLDRAEASYNSYKVIKTFVKDQYESNPCEPGDAKELLEALLGPSIASRIRDESNLIQATCLKTGTYVWVHKTELKKLGNELQACVSTPNVKIFEAQRQFELQIMSAVGIQPELLPPKYFCSWRLQVNGDRKPIESDKTKRIRYSKTMSRPVWTESFQLDNITTLEQLRTCELHVDVQRPSRVYKLRPPKELANGHVDLGDKLPKDMTNGPLSMELEIPVVSTGQEVVEKVLVTIKVTAQTSLPPP